MSKQDSKPSHSVETDSVNQETERFARKTCSQLGNKDAEITVNPTDLECLKSVKLYSKICGVHCNRNSSASEELEWQKHETNLSSRWELKSNLSSKSNGHSVDRFGTAGSIPRVSSLSVATEDEQDSEVEVVDPEILPTPSLVLRASSPAPSSSSGFNEVNMSDYFSDSMQSRPASAPPSSSSGFDLASRAFDFDTDDAGTYSDDGAGAYSDDAGAYPLTGDYDRGVEEGDHVDGFLLTGSDFLGVPGFDFNEFLDACGDAPYVNTGMRVGAPSLRLESVAFINAYDTKTVVPRDTPRRALRECFPFPLPSASRMFGGRYEGRAETEDVIAGARVPRNDVQQSSAWVGVGESTRGYGGACTHPSSPAHADLERRTTRRGGSEEAHVALCVDSRSSGVRWYEGQRGRGEEEQRDVEVHVLRDDRRAVRGEGREDPSKEGRTCRRGCRECGRDSALWADIRRISIPSSSSSLVRAGGPHRWRDREDVVVPPLTRLG
ncbi:hypothetical protein B0H13DRAFT_2275466 [Mycena leptocephala]|nr:hypothetical protein B0H13DRAFT_2275466 [Mycena leptocephala]